MSFQCGICSISGKNVVAYCVETNKVMCRKCVGLLHYPGMKSADFTIEEIDREHPGVQAITVFVMHASVVVGMLYALWRSNIGDEYFKGASTCPALSVGRQGLARFDANIFYYYKSSLATYCDIEDSFWRLLMDGWVRGVVSGSDSLLLLFSTLPKALLFKSAVSTFLRPIYAVLYASCGFLLSQCLMNFENAWHWMYNHMPWAMHFTNGNATSGRLSKWFKKVFRLPSLLKQKATTKGTWPEKVKMVCIAVGLSAAIRLALKLAGFEKLAALGDDDVSSWQLAFEPIMFFYLAHLFGLLNAKLNKTIWKKGTATTSPPLTLWRKKPNKDLMELLSYGRSRIMRSWNYYRKQAEEILHVLVDDIFNMVVVLRLVSILFNLAPVARGAATAMGLGEVIQRHSEWFFEATGFAARDQGAKYLTDRLAMFGFTEIRIGVQAIEGYVARETMEELKDFSTHLQLVWRLLLPGVLFYLEWKWAAFLKKQQAQYKKQWKGKEWKDGQYAEMMETFGSFWNEVPSKEEWVSPTIYESAAK